jgi:hypothetical protein
MTPSYATFADGHEEMLVGDAVLESSRTGSWVEVTRSGTSAASPTMTSPEGQPR